MSPPVLWMVQVQAATNISKPKMVDNGQKERVGEEKRQTPEKFQQPGYTCQTKCPSAKKNHVSFKDIPDGIPLKPVHVKRTVNRRPDAGHTEVRGDGGKHTSKATCWPLAGAAVGVSSQQHRGRLMNGATDVNGSRHPSRDLDRLPDEQWRLAKEIHKKELLIQEKLWKTGQSMRKMILQDRGSSEIWRGEPDRSRRDVDMRTEGSVGHPHEGKRGNGNTQESKSGQASAQQQQQQNHKLSEDKSPVKRRERDSTRSRGSSGEEREPEGQTRQSAHGQAAEGHSSDERTILTLSSGPQVANPIPEMANASFQRLSCKYCERRFTPASLEKHSPICERLQQSRRKVYDSSKHRTQGTRMEEFRIKRQVGTS